MADLEDYRMQWAGLRGDYERLGQYVAELLRAEVRSAGILAIVTYRLKQMDSFLKKIIRKGYHDAIQDMHDKVGARIVIPFVSHLSTVDEIIRRSLDVRLFDDKSAGLGTNKFDYQSRHYDIVLKEPIAGDLESLRGMWCEVQLRTEAQHLWAEMEHRLMYKSDQEIPKGEARRVHRLNALLEIADYEFEYTRNSLSQLPGAWSLRVLSGLESLYYELIGRAYDRELSLDVLEHLRPLCPPEPDAVIQEVREWLIANRNGIEYVVNAYKSNPERVLFLFQPEGVILAAYLRKDPFTLRERWIEIFPEEGLRQISVVLGIPYID